MNSRTNPSRALQLLTLSALLTGAFAVEGCAVRYRGRVAIAQPQLVEVQPGLWVVSDYDDAVFFSQGSYWRYSGGVWYRSTYLGGWAPAAVTVVPRPIVTIQRPARFRRYQVRQGVRARAVPRGHIRRQRRIDRRVRRQDQRVQRGVRRPGRRVVPRSRGGRVTVRPR